MPRAWAKPARVVSIALEPSEDKIALIPGDVRQIRAVATYSDKSTEDVTARMAYTSAKPEVIAVEPSGLASAIKGGDAEVAAYDPVSGKSARTSVKFKVAKLKRIDVEPADKVVPVRRSLVLRALGTYENGRTADVTSRVTWSSDKTSIASIGAGSSGEILLQGMAAGKAKIVAFEPLDRVKSDGDSGRVVVVAKLAALSIEPATLSLRNGQTASLHALGRFEGGAVADVTSYVEWSSDAPLVAVVDPGGALSAVGMGRAPIVARDPESGIAAVSGQGGATIDVLGALLGVAAAPGGATLPVGDTLQMRALAIYEGRDEPVVVSDGVRWKSSNTASVAIDATTGAVRCAAAGSALISFTEMETGTSSTATGGDARIACVADVPTVRVAPAKKLLAVGKSANLTASLLLPDGTERDITLTATWTSSRADAVSIARVGDQMRARGVAPGVALITATDPVTGTSSAGAQGIGAKLSVPGVPKVLKIFPTPTGSSGIELANGVTTLLKARVDFEGGANQGANNLVLWASSDPTVLRVSNGEDGKQPGTATPLRPGDATVSIQYPKPGGPKPQFPPSQPMSKSVKVRVR
ncbi:Ig-like domain-containing protein [Candidatus Binatia bacterium]|nr:Ig-like domain-containing protein [Candidatus Binatia bacterium]